MVKARVAIISLVLASLIAMLPVVAIPPVKATQYLNVEWGHLAPPTEEHPLDTDELQVESWTVEDVRGLYQWGGWQTWNAYGQDTTGSNLYSTLSYRQNHDVYASDFWVGDFQGVWSGYSQQWGWEWTWVYDPEFEMYLYEYAYVYDWFPDPSLHTVHYNFYGEGNNNPSDVGIYIQTSWQSSRQHFTFIWTCACGNVFPDPHNPSNYCYGFYDDFNNSEWVGMPLAWTANYYLSIDGYHDPDTSSYCYLGWNSTSLAMKTDDGCAENYENFVDRFYSYAFDYPYHNTIADSLDWASWHTWGFVWDDSNNPLGGCGTYFKGEYHWINVIGNSGITL
jgi:hypothetical protein